MLERIKEVSEAARIASIHKLEGCHSQLGEDLVIKYIAEHIGLVPGVFVDIGASDGSSMSNSYIFRDMGWEVLAFDGSFENDLVQRKYFNQDEAKRFIAAIEGENVILSLDIDGQDYWILQTLITNNKFAIICLEVNGCIQQNTPVTVPINDNFKHDGTDYYGANLYAFVKLLQDEYTLVFHHHSQNAFFVHKSFGCKQYDEPMASVQYHPHAPGKEWVTL